MWPWSTKWSRAKVDRVSPRECTGHSSHPLQKHKRWLYTWTSPGDQYQNQTVYSLPAKNIINLISVLTICWHPCVELSLVLLEWVFAMTSAFSWWNSVSLCPASFCTPGPNLPITSGISWLPIFAFQSPKMKKTSFDVSSRRSGRFS